MHVSRRALRAVTCSFAVAAGVLMAGASPAQAQVTAPQCGYVLQAVCDKTVDPQVTCALTTSTRPDCLHGAITVIRDAAADRASFCASNSDPTTCAAVLEGIEAAAGAYADPATGCLSWISAVNPACAEHLSTVSTRLAIPDPVNAAEDLAADIGMAIDDAVMRNAMCASNALADMAEASIAAGRESSLAAVQTCINQKGNGGITWYRFTNERAPSGATSAWDPTRSRSNWLIIKSCQVENVERRECVNRVAVLNARGNEVSGTLRQDVGGRNDWIGIDHASAKRGRPQCTFKGHLSNEHLKGWERFKCYFSY